ncbi:MAG: hypothetical protein KAQ94_06070 [Arcobacteraceae bacterium]|nr:hypothetical protein [Arcobacteraceae bacterium]
MATKFTPLGVVTKKLDSGMVLTDKGIRSGAKAQVGDKLKKNLTTGEIVVEKAKPVKAGSEAKQIEELNTKVETLTTQLTALNETNENLTTQLTALNETIEESDYAGLDVDELKEKFKVAELKTIAKQKGLKNYSSLKEDELAELIVAGTE